MRHAILLVLLVSAVAAAKPKRVPPPRRPAAGTTTPTASAGPGQVTFVTTTTAYLDRGALDGVTVGAGYSVTRAGRLVGRCTIATVSERWSTCTAQGGLQIGDKITVVRAPSAPPSAPAPVADSAELLARKQVIEAQPVPLVDFAGGSSGLLGSGGTRYAAVALSHSTFVNLASGDGPFHTQRVDVGVYDVPIWKGLHASADLSVLNFSSRATNGGGPAGFGGDFRSPLRANTVLLVRQLEVSFHSAELPLLASAGRTWTRHTPGLLMVDGAQAGWRNKDDSLELGAYGGMLPDPVALGVSTARWTVGAFMMARFESGKGTASRLFQLEAHAGYAVRALVPGRLELGVAANTWLGRTFDAHLQLEMGALGAQAPGLVDKVALEFGWHPVETFRINAGGRYQGALGIDAPELGVTLPGERTLHADLAATLELTPWLWIAASGGSSLDFTSALNQTRFGPEVTLPRLFGPSVSLTLGYQEEVGWIRGRTGWLQLTVTPMTRLRILARGSWFHQQDVEGNQGIAGQELGGALTVDLAITRWLWVRLSGLGHNQAATSVGRGGAIGGTVMGQLGGQL